MDHDRALLTTGVTGAIVAALCCAAPLLALMFGTLGVSAWIAQAGYVALPALLIGLGLLAFGLVRRRRARR